MQEKVSAQYKNEIEMAKAQRDYELKKADYDIEVFTKKAESEMAYQLQVRPRCPTRPRRRNPGFRTRFNPPGIFFFPPSGGQDQAAHRGGEDAGPGGGADAADHPAGAGDHPQGEGAGGQNQEARRGGEIQIGEAG